MTYQIQLSQLLSSFAVVSSDDDLHVMGISMDSREVEPGSVFLSLSRAPAQRLQFLQQALKSGAAVVLKDAAEAAGPAEIDAIERAGALLFSVSNLGQQASELAARFYQQPSKELTLLAVTGTNGKTSVTQFIAAIYQQLGVSCGVIGTLGFGPVDSLQEMGMTTPDPVRLQAMLASMRDSGMQAVALEASSHALSQGRLNAVAIDVAILTNLSHDHLDYHGDMQSYAQAKARLFRFETLKAAVINSDDDFGRQLQDEIKHTVAVTTYSASGVSADYSAGEISYQSAGMQFQLNTRTQKQAVASALFGTFNVANLLAAAAAVIQAGQDENTVIKALPACAPVRGRMQRVLPEKQPAVIVDYAHTPDALKQALIVCRDHKKQTAELWCVFGCGGDRDRTKRPLMGEIASTYADRIVLTDDNPRHEQSEQIIEEIMAGCGGDAEVVLKPSRREAIEFSILQAASYDMVLIAGKGHESYQQTGDIKMPFSDIEEAGQALQKRSNQGVAL